MKKGFYIHQGSKYVGSGVDKKIKYQLKAFLAYYEMKEIIIERENASLLKYILWCIPGGSWGYDYEGAIRDILLDVDDIMNVSFFYIRICPPDKRFIGFIEQLRKKFPKSKIIIEVPTFPYANDLIRSLTRWPWYFKNIYNVGKLRRYVDRIVTFSDDDEMFGVQTIRICNGFDVDSVRLPLSNEKRIDRECSTINLLAVANFQVLHGYERVLKGLASYYLDAPQYKVYLHMVGEGNELSYYRRLVKTLSLEEFVVFYGALSGTDLNRVYEVADIGLGVFGAYKRSICISSALKIREYLAYGLPVVSGVYEDAFPTENEYFLEFPNDNSDVDINRIVEFYCTIIKKEINQSVRTNIREYAQKTIDVSVTMQPVIEYLNDR